MLMITAWSFQVHAQLPDYVHLIISVETYAEKPGFYRLEKCSLHTTNLLTMACANCDKLFCTSCTFEGKYLWSKHHCVIMIQWAHIYFSFEVAGFGSCVTMLRGRATLEVHFKLSNIISNFAESWINHNLVILLQIYIWCWLSVYSF